MIRYDVVRNIYDGLDELSRNVSFFDSNDDKQFYLLLPKINSQKLIDSFKAYQEDNVIEFDKPHAQSEYIIQIQQQFLEDVLSFTNSINSDDSSQSELGFNNIHMRRQSRKSMRSNTNESNKQNYVDNSQQNEQMSNIIEIRPYNQSIDTKQPNSQRQLKPQYIIQIPQSQQFAISQNLFEDTRNELTYTDSDTKRESEFKKDFEHNKRENFFKQESDAKREISSSVHSVDRSTIGMSEQYRFTEKQNSFSEQQSKAMEPQKLVQFNSLKQNLFMLAKDDVSKKGIDKSKTSDFNNNNNNNSQKKGTTKSQFKQNYQISEQEDNFSIFDKTKTIKDQETFYRRDTRQNTLDPPLLQQKQNMVQSNYLDQIKYIIKQIEYQQNLTHISSKDSQDKSKKQVTVGSKNYIKSSSNSQNNLQAPSFQFTLSSNSKTGVFNHQNSQLLTCGSTHSKVYKGNSNINNDPNSWQNAGNSTKGNDCLFGKCGYKFDLIKEYDHYYPKFNYTYVIKTYKKQKQFYIKFLKQQQQQRLSQCQKIQDKKQLKLSQINLLMNKKEDSSIIFSH